MANTSKTFNKNFRKLSKQQYDKLLNAVNDNKVYSIRSSPDVSVVTKLKQSGYNGDVKWQLITSYGVKHALNRHGNDQIPVTMDDIRIIPEIQKNFDTVKVSPKKNSRWQYVVIYEKKIGDRYYYLENLNKNWFLETQTMYIE